MNKFDAIWLTGQPASGKTTLANLLLDELSRNSKKKYFNIDGDDLRSLFQNKDYSRKGREANIRLGMSIAAYLINKNCIPIVSLVSPYRNLREEFKSSFNVLEVYIHTTEIRGRENFFVKEYEPPKESFLDMNTTNKTELESLNEILNVYR
ncbi:MAG: adenylyl-sulfate kinase [Flavobacteriaceae bacterium]|jgi:adenylylsulfate kinase-like enzyme|nr:adenylyl-sulfate kinase [Flavobacteriaceae bacterium]MBT5213480.1 adenylyl-sulfate kinase [Pelagibacteraceae bacterium]MBT6170115.1 adenylyl-sulfate kinase [Flavobacteriaceae bacterium]MBT6447140.1 adenylyl-sulfate kinase [Flavobacteriaceae bacterium]